MRRKRLPGTRNPLSEPLSKQRIIVCWLTLQILAASPVVNTVFVFADMALRTIPSVTMVRLAQEAGRMTPGLQPSVSATSKLVPYSLSMRNCVRPAVHTLCKFAAGCKSPASCQTCNPNLFGTLPHACQDYRNFQPRRNYIGREDPVKIDLFDLSSFAINT